MLNPKNAMRSFDLNFESFQSYGYIYMGYYMTLIYVRFLTTPSPPPSGDLSGYTDQLSKDWKKPDFIPGGTLQPESVHGILNVRISIWISPSVKQTQIFQSILPPTWGDGWIISSNTFLFFWENVFDLT